LLKIIRQKLFVKSNSEKIINYTLFIIKGIKIYYSKYIDKFVYLITFIIVILSIFKIDLLPADDAFFYLKVAENYSNGFGFTFNKIYQTNGFHPLWMYICISINYFTKLINLQNYTIYFLAVFQIIIFYLTINKLNKLFSSKKFDYGISLSSYIDSESSTNYKSNSKSNKIEFNQIIYLVLFLIYIATGTLLLMESIIVLSLIVYISSSFYELIDKNNRTTNSNPHSHSITNSSIFYIAILISMLFLARLDSIFFIFYFSILLLYLLIQSNQSKQSNQFKLTKPKVLKSILIYVITLVFIISIYLFYNKINFGSFGTISSEIKNKFPHFIFDDINIWGRVILISNLIYIIILNLFKDITLKKIKVLLILTSITHILFAFCFQLNTAQWYWNFGYLSLSFLLYDLVLIIKNKLNLNYFEDLIKIFLLVLIVFTFFTKNNLLNDFNKKHQIKQLVENIENNSINNNIIIYTYDFPGRLAYYSNFQVIPFDGLISNKEYIEDLKKYSIKDYIKNKKINYLITPIINNSDTELIKRLNYQIQKVTQNTSSLELTIFNPITLKNGKSIQLENNKLLYKFKNPLIKWQKEYIEIGIWDLSKLNKQKVENNISNYK